MTIKANSLPDRYNPGDTEERLEKFRDKVRNAYTYQSWLARLSMMDKVRSNIEEKQNSDSANVLEPSDDST